MPHRNALDDASLALERQFEADPSDTRTLQALCAHRRRTGTAPKRTEWLAAWTEWRAAGADVWYGGTPAPPEIEAIQQELAAELRRQDPRIRRSKRRDWCDLNAWAGRVLGEERVAAVREPFYARIKAIQEETRGRADRAREIVDYMALRSRPEPGPEAEWKVIRYGSSPFDEESDSALRQAVEAVAIARRLGLEARAVHERGTWVPGWGWHRGHLEGAGYRVLAGVAHPSDLEILDAYVTDKNRRHLDAFSRTTRLCDEGSEKEGRRVWHAILAEDEALRREGMPFVQEAPAP